MIQNLIDLPVGAFILDQANAAAVQGLIQEANSRLINASETYIEQGKIFKKIFFVKKGILRSYYITPEGEEKTIFFRSEGQFGAAPECIFNQQPSKQIWQALEDCELMEVDFEKMLQLSEQDTGLLKLRVGFAQNMLLEGLQRLESFVTEKPIDRYLHLMAQKPQLLQRVPDKYIASFIGVTPVTLSRIRRRLATRKN
jgi:CRP-like cAMP-binding protein